MQIKKTNIYTFYYLFCLYTNSLSLKNLKTKKDVNAKLSEFFIYAKSIIYLLLLYNLHEYSFKSGSRHLKQK